MSGETKIVLSAPAGMGLDLSRPEELTDEERAAFAKSFQSFGGRPHIGLNFWLDGRIDILKRYRTWSGTITDRAPDGHFRYSPNGYGFVYLYAMGGYTAGVNYIVHMEQRQGLTREMVLEGIAAAFLWLGPRGMEAVAQGLADYEWIEPAGTPNFPENWQPDPEAFASGLDFEDPELSPAELERLTDWYRRVEGEVPRYVPFLGANGGRVLKAHRRRFEQSLKLLPKQVMPYLMLHIDVMRGHREGIREGVLLAQGFGMTKAQTMEAIAWGLFYGGVETGSIVDEAAGDLIDGWTGP